jgi:hypothetical protein
MEKELLEAVLQIHCEMKIMHWQTKSYAEHVGFERVLNGLDPLFDTLIETYSGKYKRPLLDGPSKIEITDYKDIKVDVFISNSIDFFNGLFIGENDEDLAAIRDEIVVEFNKLKYLLTLK